MSDDRSRAASGETRAAPDPADPNEMGAGIFEEEMGPSSAMAHLYRGEVHRMRYWRERLDKTTNWAVIVMAGVLTWAFSSPSNPQYIVLAGVAALSVFLWIEARRYRGYDIWRSRVRSLQVNVFAYGLDTDQGLEDPNWREHLSRDYRHPRLKVTMEEALAHRLRRVYLPLFGIMLVAWLVHVTTYSSARLPASATIGPIPGAVVLAAVLAYYLALIAVAGWPRTWHVRGELFDEDLREENEDGGS